MKKDKRLVTLQIGCGLFMPVEVPSSMTDERVFADYQRGQKLGGFACLLTAVFWSW